MLYNYLVSAVRNITRNKFHSFVNIFGLAIGLAFSTLIALYIRDENSFDRFHSNRGNIFRIEAKDFSYGSFKNGSTEPFELTAVVRAGVGEAVRQELPEVVRMTRIFGRGDGVLRNQTKVFTESIKGVDSSFFKMFDFDLLAGNPNKIFRNHREVVLTPQIATKYFGKEDPLGKTMVLDFFGESNTVTVAGVIEPAPGNSSITYDVLIQAEDWPGLNRGWSEGSNCITFVELKPNTDVTTFVKNLNRLSEKYTDEKQRAFRKQEKIPDNYVSQLRASNIEDIHFKAEIPSERSSDPMYSKVLSGLALLIMVVACINYISIALANASTRSKEVGVRKISGALRRQLTFQFGTESVVISILAMILGCVIVATSLPAFNAFTKKSIVISASDWIMMITCLMAIAVAVGIIAGSYPALFLSNLKPALILKSRFATKARIWIIKPLIIVQFACSAFLIMVSLVMQRQMNFLLTKDLGYDQHQVLIIPTHQNQDESTDRFVENYRRALTDIPSVKSVAGAGVAFTQGTFGIGYQSDGQFRTANGYIVDPEYIRTLGIDLVMGRNFDIRNPVDAKDAVIINESLVKQMNWKNPLEEHLNWRSGMGGVESNIIGVVKDHNFLSLENDIGPMFLTMDKTFGHYQFMMVKISPENIPGSVNILADTFKELAPDQPFEYTFLEESVALQYASYERWMNIMTGSTAFAILISCLGLFGLSGINASNRTKEIGIRKSIGAGIADIFMLLNKQFIFFSVLSFILAIIPSWYAITRWLENFHFRVQLDLMLYAVGLGVSLLVALATLSYHSLKAIRINTVECLRHE